MQSPGGEGGRNADAINSNITLGKVAKYRVESNIDNTKDSRRRAIDTGDGGGKSSVIIEPCFMLHGLSPDAQSQQTQRLKIHQTADSGWVGGGGGRRGSTLKHALTRFMVLCEGKRARVHE
jgi:hypothetical protein